MAVKRDWYTVLYSRVRNVVQSYKCFVADIYIAEQKFYEDTNCKEEHIIYISRTSSEAEAIAEYLEVDTPASFPENRA